MNKDYKEQYRKETGEELFYTYSVPPSAANKYVMWLEEKLDEMENKPLSFEVRDKYSCKVCSNAPDVDGMIEHGKGCFTQSSDGGGISFVDFPEEGV